MKELLEASSVVTQTQTESGGLHFGDIAGDYRVVRVLGEGGSGIVYHAVHRFQRSSAAIKVAKAADPDSQQRLLQEARLLASVSHHGISAALDVGRCPDGRVFLAMEMITGRSLGDILDEDDDLGIRRAVTIGKRVANALAMMHAAGIIHRDVTPHNIILRKTLTGDQPVVIDFGNSQHVRSGGGFLHCPEGIVAGTPHYMSPEQARGRGIDERSDIYSLGAVLFEMIAGEPVFDGDTPKAVVLQHVYDPAPVVHCNGQPVPARLRDIVARCLEKDPAKRYQTAVELSSALGGVTRRRGRHGLVTRSTRRKCDDRRTRQGRLARVVTPR